jgi:hypothetical protein
MIGALYLQQLNELLSEFGGNWINRKISFDYLYKQPRTLVKRLRPIIISKLSPPLPIRRPMG